MTKEIVSTENAPAALGPYSQAAIANGIVYCSGQLGIAPGGSDFVSNDVAEQTDQCLKNLTSVLEAAGSSLNNAVKVTIFLADMGDFVAVNEVYGRYFNEPYPARACIQAACLPKSGLVEIELIATVD